MREDEVLFDRAGINDMIVGGVVFHDGDFAVGEIDEMAGSGEPRQLGTSWLSSRVSGDGWVSRDLTE